MNRKWTLFAAGLVLFLLAGCVQEKITYQCADGSLSSLLSSCPAIKKPVCPNADSITCPEPVIQEKVTEKLVDVIKYQCSDGSVKDSLSDCSSQEPIQSQKQTFSGNKDTVTDKFYLKKGLAIFKFTYEGDSNFIVSIVDEEGNSAPSLANEIGEYSGTKTQTISKAGYYRLQIEIGTSYTGSGFSSTADWSIDVEQ